MNLATILLVPDWVGITIRFFERNWIAIAGILLIAIISCVTIWALKYKRKWSLKYEKEKAQAIIRWVILAVTSFFTFLGTLLYFVQSNQPIIADMFSKILPHTAVNLSEVLGVLWVVYNFRLRKDFQKWEARAKNVANIPLGSSPIQLSTAVEPLVKPTFDNQ